ncbi:MAG: LysR family transcriptional regulator [Clostridia bacterium]
MEIRQLVYFLDLCKTMSFTRTAENCYLSQSNVSKQVTRLEKELGVLLFQRHSQGIKLTQAGQRLVPHAMTIVEEHQSLLQDLQPHALTIGVLPVLAAYGLGKLFSRFRLENPTLRLSIFEDSRMALKQALMNGDIELCFLRLTHATEIAKVYPLMTDELVLVVCQAQAISSSDVISLSLYAQSDFILLSPSTGLHESCLQCCRQAKFEPKVIYCGASASAIGQLVAQGVGVAMMLSQIAHSLKEPSLHIYRFEETVRFPIVLAAREDRSLSPEGQAFWNFITKS